MFDITMNHNHRFAVLEEALLVPIKRGEFDKREDAEAFVAEHLEWKLYIVEAVDGFGYR